MQKQISKLSGLVQFCFLFFLLFQVYFSKDCRLPSINFIGKGSEDIIVENTKLKRIFIEQMRMLTHRKIYILGLRATL